MYLYNCVLFKWHILKNDNMDKSYKLNNKQTYFRLKYMYSLKRKLNYLIFWMWPWEGAPWSCLSANLILFFF